VLDGKGLCDKWLMVALRLNKFEGQRITRYWCLDVSHAATDAGFGPRP